MGLPGNRYFVSGVSNKQVTIDTRLRESWEVEVKVNGENKIALIDTGCG